MHTHTEKKKHPPFWPLCLPLSYSSIISLSLRGLQCHSRLCSLHFILRQLLWSLWYKAKSKIEGRKVSFTKSKNEISFSWKNFSHIFLVFHSRFKESLHFKHWHSFCHSFVDRSEAQQTSDLKNSIKYSPPVSLKGVVVLHGGYSGFQ